MRFFRYSRVSSFDGRKLHVLTAEVKSRKKGRKKDPATRESEMCRETQKKVGRRENKTKSPVLQNPKKSIRLGQSTREMKSLRGRERERERAGRTRNEWKEDLLAPVEANEGMRHDGISLYTWRMHTYIPVCVCMYVNDVTKEKIKGGRSFFLFCFFFIFYVRVLDVSSLGIPAFFFFLRNYLIFQDLITCHVRLDDCDTREQLVPLLVSFLLQLPRFFPRTVCLIRFWRYRNLPTLQLASGGPKMARTVFLYRANSEKK